MAAVTLGGDHERNGSVLGMCCRDGGLGEKGNDVLMFHRPY